MNRGQGVSSEVLSAGSGQQSKFESCENPKATNATHATHRPRSQCVSRARAKAEDGEFLPARRRLKSARHCWCGTRLQAQVNDKVQLGSDLSVEILWARVVLSDVRARIFRKTGASQESSRALSAAIGFCWCRHSTLFILHYWRPVSVEYSFQQLRKILANHLGRRRRLDASVLLPIHGEVENQGGLA